MRGAPSQWDVGSMWIGDGGAYPGMGDSIGLAGTSPSRVQGGLFNDGGAVGDPPFDEYTNNVFEDSMGAYDGTPTPVPNGGGSGGGGGGGDGEIDNPLTGLLIFAGGTLAFFWALHRFRVGDKDKFASIKGTAGDLAIIAVAGTFGIPLVKSSITYLADVTDWGLLHDTAAYANGA
jgi:hypothetical protein